MLHCIASRPLSLLALLPGAAGIAVQLRHGTPSGSGPHVRGQCGQFKPSDLVRPIREVLAEHPGVNGFCYFAGAEAWISQQAPEPDYVQSSKAAVLGMRNNVAMPGTCTMSYPEGQGPLKTAHFEGGTVSSHIDCNYYEYDDLYFYSLGWLKNQRLDGSLMSNATAWEALAREECDRLQEMFHFRDEEITMQKHGQRGDNMVILAKSQVAFSGKCQIIMKMPPSRTCDPITSREFASHAYGKCLLGGAAGDAAEMAYAYSRACLLPGNIIGHESACD